MDAFAPQAAAPSSEEELDERLAIPYPSLIALMSRLDGDLAILGIAGKMGLTLGAAAVNAIRAAGVRKQVYGVSRFSDPATREAVVRSGVVPISCDLLDRAAVARLPDATNLIFMAGRKFGTDGEEALTWAMNTVAPALVAERYAGKRIVAFSTGCVYPLLPLGRIGAQETDRPEPVGEYAQSCLGRERIFEHFSRKDGTRVCLIRLNYALDLRYGVLHDLARTIWAGRPVDRTVGYFNGIWQGDANQQSLLALDRCASPGCALNLTGPETVSVTQAATELGRLLDRPVSFVGEPGPLNYLNHAGLAHGLFGYPQVPLPLVLRWTAEWVRRGGSSLGKPTHFEVANGKF